MVAFTALLHPRRGAFPLRSKAPLRGEPGTQNYLGSYKKQGRQEKASRSAFSCLLSKVGPSAIEGHRTAHGSE